MTDIYRRLEGLSPEQREELFRKLRKEKVVAASKPAAIPRVPRNGQVFPTSFAQQRLWFLAQLEPGSPRYNLTAAVRMEGTLDVGALQRSFDELVRRHEALRTTFSTRDGVPVQELRPPAPMPMRILDLGGMPGTEQEAEGRRRFIEEAHRPFDLARGPLMRGVLLRQGEREHVLLLTMHHIVSDGWSMGVLIREIAALYGAYAAGRPSPLPEPELQYVDYALWQRERLQGEALEKQLAYWRRELEGAPQVLELPTDRPRPEVQGFRGASLPIRLNKVVSEQVRALARREGATPFMVLVAAYGLLLQRYSGQEDVCIGSPIAGRGRQELEGLIGFFVNTLVLRARLGGAPTFRELVGRVRETTLGAYAHQDVAFEKLVEELQPRRSLDRSPLVQVSFALQNAPMPELALAGLTLGQLALDTEVVRFELGLTLCEMEQGFAGTFEYNSDLYEAATVERMGQQLELLLEGALAEPERRLPELPLLGAEERRRVLVEWNDTRADLPACSCVHELFEGQVARAPQAPAVAFEDVVLTYRELDRRANRLAHHLRGLGVGPEVRVALCVERSPELVVGMLGILKAGGAFVPLDPSYPRERLAFMLRDAAAPVLVTREALADELPSLGEQVVCLDADGEVLSRQPEENPTSGATADNLAYVIYTSGSTGRPKGTLLAHRGLCNTALAAARAQRLRPDSRVLQFAAASFDASVWEVFSTLLAGACLVLAPREQLLPDAPLRGLLEGQRITAVTLTPSVLARLSSDGLPHLETVTSAGEALAPELARRWTQGGRTLLNAYGPTEVTVCATITRGSVSPERVTIGQPWANVQVYALDPGMQPVPIGVPGELYVGGVGLARGYLNRPELTAERFVPHPFSSLPGARLYRTGDRVRFLADGRLEYLGRADAQVKLRGLRIELGEVEAVLGQHPSVREVVVLLRRDAPGDERLVAYVVGRGGGPEPRELRRFLEERLPDYMVPSAFVVLESLPLSPGGKVDRQALPAPEASPGGGAEAKSAPRTPTEELVAGIWAEVLQRGPVGPHSDFFELGGHSLLATQVVSRIRSAFGVELPLRELFAVPTVAGLAERVDAAVREGLGLQAPPLMPVPRTGALPLSFAQQRLWFLDQLDPGSPAYNIPTALRLEGALDVAALERSFQELVRRHESLRTTFRAEGGQAVQVVSAELPVPLEVVDLGGLPPEERVGKARRLAEEAAATPFDLGRGPLLRVHLLRLDERQHALLLNMHHIVSDGWSAGVLVREVTALYEAFSQGRPSPLPELPVQYVDYAVWQRGWLQGEVLERQLDFWRRQLASAPQALELPTDRPRPPMQSFRGALQPVSVPGPLAVALESLGRKEGVTPFMLLLAAFQVLLHRYSGQDDISVGSPVAGRRYAELEGLIGFFVNMLVLRARLEGAPSFQQLLRQTRETALGAFAHQDVPFEKLVEELRPARDPSRSPLFQAMFIFQNVPSGGDPDPAAGLSVRPLEIEGGVAKFDLTLTLVQGPEGLKGALEYNTDLFEHGTAARMVGHLRVLLEGLVARPEARIGELSLMEEAERRQVLVEWNDTRAELPADACVHAIFEAQVERTPDALAVAFEDTALTYRQLDERANRLARRLRSLGVGPEVRVALCLERSHELVIALLAILKAGGAYVPLDPAWPAERLGFMLGDSGARVLLTRRELASRVDAPDVHAVLLEDAGEHLASLPARPFAPATCGDNLAYVLYTSGSTGRPKGVMVPHRTVANFFGGMDARLARPAAGGVWLAVTSISFDISVLELLWTLTRGFEVVVQPDVASPGWLARQVARHRVTHLQCTPSLAQALLLEPSAAEALRGLRQLLVGGEALPPELARQLLERLPEGGLLNLYGPTETTVWSSTHAVREVSGSIPLGTPIANTTLYVLDERGQPAPLGVPGELYIGGEGVVRGYLGRPELSAGRFVPDPFGSRPGARLYRTGDRARWRPDGTVEFLGRVDLQVKVRGHRIEPGEIEARLDRHPSVRRAVVAVREEGPGDKRLVAYVVPAGGPAPGADALRAWVREALPEFMVPSVFVVLEALPLTPNGKVDRKALPAPTRRQEARGMVPPRTPAEQALARIWTRVLGVEQVGVHDSFFELGGDSLGGLRMVALAGQVGLALQLRQLFQHPTLEALAAVAGAAPPGAEAGTPGPVGGPEGDEDLPLTPWQQWYVETFDVEQHVWALSMLWDVPPEIQPGPLWASVAFLVEHHDVLRLRLHRGEGGWRQRLVASAGEPILEVLELGGLAPDARREAILERVGRLQSTLSITRGPVLALVLCRMGGAGPDKLLVCIHHCVYDAYSLPLLLEDLLGTYQQVAAGQPPGPPRVSAGYWQYARAMEAYSRSGALREARAFWLDDAGLGPAEPLPVDLEGGQHTDLNSQRLRLPLPPMLARAMLAYLGSHEDTQLNELLLFGLARAYARWSGGRALRLDVEHNGRTGLLPGVDLTRTIGPTTIKFPVRFELRGGEASEVAFAEVRRTLRETMAHALGHGCLRYGPDDEVRRRLVACGSPQVFFNNRRAAMAQARPAEEGPRGLGEGEHMVVRRADGKPNPVSYDLMVECDGFGTALTFSWVYSSALHREETIRRLAQEFFAQLAALVGGA